MSVSRLLVAVLFLSGAAFAQDSEVPVPSPPPPPPHVEPIPNEVPPPPDAPPPVPPADGPPPQQVQPGAEEPQPPPPVPPARRTRERAREYGRDPDEPQRPDWRTPRKGFHFSAGLGGMVYPGQSNGAHSSVEAVGYVAVLPAVSYSWGWLEAHLTVQALGYLTSESKALFVAADPQLRINFAPWYSLGFGPYLGVAASPKLEGVAGLSISPIIFKLGDRGQHEVALWSATPFLFTNNHSGISLLLLSYSFVFI